MSDQERRALALAAGDGDLAAYRRLGAILERESPSPWRQYGCVVRRSEWRRDARLMIVRLRSSDLSEATCRAWLTCDFEALDAAIAADMKLPITGFQIEAIWDEVQRRETHVLIWHPSFHMVRDGEHAPFFPDVSPGREPNEMERAILDQLMDELGVPHADRRGVRMVPAGQLRCPTCNNSGHTCRACGAVGDGCPACSNHAPPARDRRAPPWTIGR